MAPATAKPEKRLGEFLKEQQEPFILEVYLLERGYSKNWNSHGVSSRSLENPASSGLNKKRKSLFPFLKALTALHKKLASHSQSSTEVKDSDTRNEHANVTVPHEVGSVDQAVVETDRFSTASSSTMFNSCSDIEEDGTSLSLHKDKPLFSSDTCQASSVCNMGVQSQQATNNGKHHQRCIEVSVTHEKLDQDVSVWGVEQRIHSCGVIVPKKITEDSLLSAALWSSLIQTAKRENYSTELQELLGHDASRVLKSKWVLHKTKQLLFDCVRDITRNPPRKDGRQNGCKQFMGPEKLGKIIWERTKEWSQRAGNETNLTNLLTLDYLDSIHEWSEFKPQVKDVSVEIADAILERVNNEILSEMIEIFPPTI